MNREIHVPLREGVGVRFPRATRPFRPPSVLPDELVDPLLLPFLGAWLVGFYLRFIDSRFLRQGRFAELERKGRK
jgi:hypothetical protein